MDVLVFQKILLALAIGSLIGLEREHRVKDRKQVFAGLRTFMLMCMLGVLVPYISYLIGCASCIFVGFAAIVAMVIVSYYIRYKEVGKIGMTTEIAFLITFLIGVLLFFEGSPYFLSISLGVIITMILFVSQPLHDFAHHLKDTEIRDAIVFAAVVFIVMPLLPNMPIDPFGAINPYVVWLSLVVIMTISFAGYVAIKIFGDKLGVGLMGFFGGLWSSTSVAVSMADRMKKSRGVVKSAVFAILVSSATMFPRMVFLSGVFNPDLAIAVAPYLLSLGLIGYALSYKAFRGIKGESARIEFSSPISFVPIIKFMLIFIVVMVAARITTDYFPSAIYLTAILTGLFDVDAITISLASATMTALPFQTVVNAVIVAAVSNTISKAFLSRWLSGDNGRKEIDNGFLPLVAFGIIIVAFRLFTG
jgi:uncharacterized membrane protein (DUF4010 family)